MARVSILSLWYWECPLCERHVKAWKYSTAKAGAEYHLYRDHAGVAATQGGVTLPTLLHPEPWEPEIERRTWAFNVLPEAAGEPRSWVGRAPPSRRPFSTSARCPDATTPPSSSGESVST